MVALSATCLVYLSQLLTRLAYKLRCEPAYVRPHFQTNISKMSGPKDIRKAALGLGPDQIGTLVSMATDSPHLYSCNHSVLDGFEIRPNWMHCGVSYP